MGMNDTLLMSKRIERLETDMSELRARVEMMKLHWPTKAATTHPSDIQFVSGLSTAEDYRVAAEVKIAKKPAKKGTIK